MASLLDNLNRRHKAALFLTLLIAGLTLIFSESVLTALGVTLLCLAFTWAVGSDSRAVHYAFLVVGLVVLLGPLVQHGAEWWEQHRTPLAKDLTEEWEDVTPGEEWETVTPRDEAREGTVGWWLEHGDPVMELSTIWLPGALLTALGLGLILGVKPRGNAAQP